VLLRLFFLAFILKKFGFSLEYNNYIPTYYRAKQHNNSADRQKTNVKLKRKNL
jgi:hypothetical protein